MRSHFITCTVVRIVFQQKLEIFHSTFYYILHWNIHVSAIFSGLIIFSNVPWVMLQTFLIFHFVICYSLVTCFNCVIIMFNHTCNEIDGVTIVLFSSILWMYRKKRQINNLILAWEIWHSSNISFFNLESMLQISVMI